MLFFYIFQTHYSTNLKYIITQKDIYINSKRYTANQIKSYILL